MLRKTLRVFVIVLGLPVAAAAAPRADHEQKELATTRPQIVRMIADHLDREAAAATRSTLTAPASLAAFYQRRNHRPLWHDASGRLTENALNFLNIVPDVVNDGLVPDDYHLSEVDALSGPNATAPDRIARRDLLLSDGFLLLALHLRDGRVDQDTLGPRLRIDGVAASLLTLLDEAVKYERVDQTLDGLRPPFEGYWTLRRTLSRYYAIEAAGGWPRLNAEGSLRESDSGPSVTALRQRLTAEPGLGVAVKGLSPIFDTELTDVVKRYQFHHGLVGDGVVGPATRNALNIPAHARIRQIEANLERWRWLPQVLGPRFVFVNIANYRLTAYVDHTTVLSMKVVVGKPYRRTPVFNDEIKYMVLNPSWEVPETILYEDIIPALREDTGMLARQNFRLLAQNNGEWQNIDPAQVDWPSALAPGKKFPFRLRQLPGTANPLGKLKFVFPNQYDVYLHDTPSRELFKRRVRDFSSGCIRVENPVELATFLLGSDSPWTAQTLTEAIASGKERTVRLPQTVPIYIQYFTVWNGRDDVMQFRDDIYGRDDALAEALALRS